MSGVPYVGRYPDSDSSLVHKQYIDTRYGQIAVDLDYVNSSAASEATARELVTQSYVDSRDLLRAKKTDVDAADDNYVPLTQIGQPNGVATIGNDGFIPTQQLPVLVTDRVPVVVNVSTVSLSTRTVTTTSTKEFLAATININDPGYPYIPHVFGSISGSSGGEQSAIRRKNSGGFGKMQVLTPTDQVVAGGVGQGTFQPRMNLIRPTCPPNATPISIPTLKGATTLILWLSLWSGSAYTFTSSNFSFYAILHPGA